MATVLGVGGVYFKVELWQPRQTGGGTAAESNA